CRLIVPTDRVLPPISCRWKYRVQRPPRLPASRRRTSSINAGVPSDELSPALAWDDRHTSFPRGDDAKVVFLPTAAASYSPQSSWADRSIACERRRLTPRQADAPRP